MNHVVANCLVAYLHLHKVLVGRIVAGLDVLWWPWSREEFPRQNSKAVRHRMTLRRTITSGCVQQFNKDNGSLLLYISHYLECQRRV